MVPRGGAGAVEALPHLGDGDVVLVGGHEVVVPARERELGVGEAGAGGHGALGAALAALLGARPVGQEPPVLVAAPGATEAGGPQRSRAKRRMAASSSGGRVRRSDMPFAYCGRRAGGRPGRSDFLPPAGRASQTLGVRKTQEADCVFRTPASGGCDLGCGLLWHSGSPRGVAGVSPRRPEWVGSGALDDRRDPLAHAHTQRGAAQGAARALQGAEQGWPPTRAPEHPSGWPSAIAPPCRFTRAGSSFSFRITPIDCAANASFSSHTSTSSTLRPRRSRALREAGTGP